MAWFRKDKKPRTPLRQRHEIPADAWEKCEQCDHTDIREKFARNLNVCPSCGFHRRIRAIEYVNILLDDGTVEELEGDLRSKDPLNFPDYPARLKKAHANAGDEDAILTVSGALGGMPVNVGCMDFAFMGGSMGSVVGEKIARLGQRSLERKYPLVLISASGGARMQEGVLSLMQMAKTSAVLAQLADRRIPYVSILTNPTTGGVSASYAMLGDAIIAEPGAVIGFAGPRVIKQTLGQDLPEGFQTAEFLLDHGMVDQVVPRADLKRTVGTLLRHMSGKPAASGVGRELKDYRQALDFLFERTQGRDKLGLERMRDFLRVIGDPHERLRCFHVAGTNGKGSTVATLETLLRAQGLTVGKYTSPHLVDFTERILVNGEPVGNDAVVEFVQRWTPDVERTGASFFEATTALAFDVFEQAQVDVAVIEVGLGGRLDSTNVITPVVAGVTSIGLDHQELLGETEVEIAGEKAGIFKAGVPAVIGETRAEIRDELVRHARERGATPIRVVSDESRVSDVHVGPDGTTFGFAMAGALPVALRTSLAGRHQADNAAVALTMLDAAGPAYRMTPAQIAAALPGVRLPGRFQLLGKHLFDVAHNADGMAVMERTLQTVNPPRPAVAVLNVLNDKDWRAMMAVLARFVDHLVLTVSPTSPASRRWDPAEAFAYAQSHGWAATLEPDFTRALALADTMGQTVIVTGSFHTVGDAMVALNVSPLAR